jgi:hypothetical protein
MNPPIRPDAEETRRALQALFQPGQVIELRALEVRAGSREGLTASGYFMDHAALVEAALTVAESAKGVYVTLNEINPALLARAVNRVRIVRDKDPLTSDGDVVRRRWLPIDCDPTRPAGISSTDEEHALAIERAKEIRAALRAEGWDEPILADSGNGAHLLYRVDLPRDDGAFTRDFLADLAARLMTRTWPWIARSITRRASGSSTARWRARGTTRRSLADRTVWYACWRCPNDDSILRCGGVAPAAPHPGQGA